MTSRDIVILITGASSGIGFGLVQRFIKHFCHKKSAQQTQSSRKDNDFITLIADDDCVGMVTIILASSNKERAQMAINELMMNHDFEPYPLSRVKLDYLQVDLSSVESVVQACHKFKHRYQRLDYLYLNAGMLPIEKINIWTGLSFFVRHPVMFFMDVSATLEQQVGRTCKSDPSMAFLFCTNLFGHYIMYKLLLGIMRCDTEVQGRIIWTASQTSDHVLKHFRWSDVQALASLYPYECSKIGSNLASIGINNQLIQQGSSVRSYVCEPGVVSTNILGNDIHWLLQKCVIVPFIYLASFLFTFITFSAWNGAASLFYLSGFSSKDVCYDDETGNVISKEPWDTTVKYSSNFSRYGRKCFVSHRKMLIRSSDAVIDPDNELDCINEANADRMVAYLDRLFDEKINKANFLKV